jgi:RNA polymerase sigma-B factor
VEDGAEIRAVLYSTFAAYAIPTIRGEVKRHFRDRGWLVRPTRRVQEHTLALAEATSTLRHRLGREPNDQDLLDYLDLCSADLARARQAPARVLRGVPGHPTGRGDAHAG